MKNFFVIILLILSISNILLSQEILEERELTLHISNFLNESLEYSERQNSLEQVILHYSAVQPDSMMTWVKRGQNDPLNANDAAFNCWLINMEGEAYFHKGQYANSRTYFKTARELAIQNSDIKNEAKAYEGLSKSYLYGNDKDSVTYYGIKAIELFEQLADTSSQIQTLFSLYQVQLGVRNFESSLEYLNHAYALVYDSNAAEWYGTTNLNKGIYYYSLASKVEHTDTTLYLSAIDSTMLYYQNALRTYRADDNDQRQAITLANLGLVYQEKFEWQKAYQSFVEARDLAQKFNNQDYIIGFESQMAHCLSKMGDPQSALPILFRAVDHFKKSQNAVKIADAYNNISQAYADMGNYKQALKYKNGQLNTQLEAYDSLTIQKVNNLEVKYESEKKEAEIHRLNLEDDLNQLKISRQRIALGISGAGLSLLAFLLYRIFGQNKKIAVQKDIISDSLSEKETLLKEIHHRVKNNMQVISSLLRIQSNQTNDAGALAALQDGQSRVQSMSLIHQDLYQHDNLKGIYMPDYLDKLTASLLQTYQLSSNKIKILTDIEDITLDVDTVVPLGLIINELISNALKYAFPNDQNGVIQVALRERTEQLILTVRDDGIGLRDEAAAGFGNGLIEAFANKLEASLDVDGSDGVSVTMDINDYQKVLA